MRINTLRFKNLASLAGEWRIDFTHPAFAACGLFAVTGQTGAGKSTILDAICLALYGQTPRLGKVSLARNEIMTRHTSHCFAEVVFETRQGRFLCRWAQDKGKGKARTEDKPVTHVLEVLEALHGGGFSGEAEEDAASRVKRVTGLDFIQFTRSMLLAQGDFAAFMEARPADRALVLERITGTEVYADISRRTYERHDAEEKQLALMQAELHGLSLLDDDQRARLAERLEAGQAATSTAQSRLHELAEVRNWLEARDRLHSDAKGIAEKRAALQERRSLFAPEAETLRLAKQALELEAAYTALTACRRDTLQSGKQLETLQAALPELEKAEQDAVTARNAADILLAARVREEQEATPTLQQVRGLDLRIQEKSETCRPAEQGVQTLQDALNVLHAEQERDHAVCALRQDEIARLRREQEAAAAHASLPAGFSGIKARVLALQALLRQANDRLAAFRNTEAAVVCAEKNAATLTGMVQERLKAVQDCESGMKDREIRRRALLEDREPAYWRQTLERLKEQGLRLRELYVRLEQLRGDQPAGVALDAELTALDVQRQAKTEAVRVHEALLPGLERELALHQRIQSLEAHRALLEDGRPCPLCGATEHPFAAAPHLLNGMSENGCLQAQSALNQTRQALEQTRTGVRDLEISRARLSTRREALCVRMDEARRHAAAMLAESADYADSAELSDLSEASVLSETGPVPQAVLEAAAATTVRQLETCRSRYRSVETVLRDMDALDAALKALRVDLDARRAAQHTAEQHKNSADTASQTIARDRDRLRTEHEALRTEHEAAFCALRAELWPFMAGLEPEFGWLAETSSISAVKDQDFTTLLSRLKTLAEAFTARAEALGRLTEELAALKAALDQRAKTMDADARRLLDAQTQLAAQKKELKSLQQQRQVLFGARSPDVEALRLQEAVTLARQTCQIRQQAQDSVAADRQRHSTLLETAVTTHVVHVTALEREQSMFTVLLDQSPFAAEADFVTALLPAARRQALERTEAELLTIGAELEAQSSQLHEASLAHEARQRAVPGLRELPDGTDLPAVAREIEVTETRRRELEQETGALNQQLRDDDRRRQSREAYMIRVEAQKRELERWARLNALIGTKNGNMYRNFAQELTFAALLEHANRQLRKMTDRYTLVPHEREALTLNVTDHYQADEVRSAANLSGGETFMVSLALALGLSDMAGRHTGVDSLFLDEGFGTLDAEALDMALETLSSLQSEGKRICVISHVPALKERLGTLIEVRRKAGGRSVLEGPGCSRVTEYPVLTGGLSDPPGGDPPCGKPPRGRRHKRAVTSATVVAPLTASSATVVAAAASTQLSTSMRDMSPETPAGESA